MSRFLDLIEYLEQKSRTPIGYHIRPCRQITEPVYKGKNGRKRKGIRNKIDSVAITVRIPEGVIGPDRELPTKIRIKDAEHVFVRTYDGREYYPASETVVEAVKSVISYEKRRNAIVKTVNDLRRLIVNVTRKHGFVDRRRPYEYIFVPRSRNEYAIMPIRPTKTDYVDVRIEIDEDGVRVTDIEDATIRASVVIPKVRTKKGKRRCGKCAKKFFFVIDDRIQKRYEDVRRNRERIHRKRKEKTKELAAALSDIRKIVDVLRRFRIFEFSDRLLFHGK